MSVYYLLQEETNRTIPPTSLLQDEITPSPKPVVYYLLQEETGRTINPSLLQDEPLVPRRDDNYKLYVSS